MQRLYKNRDPFAMYEPIPADPDCDYEYYPDGEGNHFHPVFYEWDPIYQAVFENKLDDLKIALAEAKTKGTLYDLNTIWAWDRRPQPPLHVAFRLGYAPCVKLLMDHGASLTVEDAFYGFPIGYACKYGHWGLLKDSITWYKKDPKYKPEDLAWMLNYETFDGIMPIHHAAEEDNIEMIKLLLEHGARASSPAYDQLAFEMCVTEEARDLLLSAMEKEKNEEEEEKTRVGKRKHDEAMKKDNEEEEEEEEEELLYHKAATKILGNSLMKDKEKRSYIEKEIGNNDFIYNIASNLQEECSATANSKKSKLSKPSIGFASAGITTNNGNNGSAASEMRKKLNVTIEQSCPNLNDEQQLRFGGKLIDNVPKMEWFYSLPESKREAYALIELDEFPRNYFQNMM